MSKLAAFTLIPVIAFVNSIASAQDFDEGKSEYQSSCAACHGEDGKGNGPVSSQLKVPPSDLTVLAKKNNGVFPVKSVYEVIDGRQAVLAHGTRDMPIWGNRYIAVKYNRRSESILSTILRFWCELEFYR